MNKIILFALLMCGATQSYANNFAYIVPYGNVNPCATLSSNFVTYPSPSAATVTIALPSTSNSDIDFVVNATLDSVPIAVTNVNSTTDQIVTPVLSAGTHTVNVQTYFENANLGADLRASVVYYQSDMASLNSQIASTTDPATLALLNYELQGDQAALSAVNADLINNLTLACSGASITLTIQ